jgi:hypothetical protein
MLKDNGADHLPTALTPSLPDLFHAPTDSKPVNPKHFRKLIGSLIYLLKTRHDIRKEVQFLASRSTAPTQSCLAKVIRVLAFLNSTPSDGVRFYSDDPTVHVYVDAAYGVHTDGRSQTGYFITIGKNSAPVYSHAGLQRHCVSTGSMEAEYVGMTEACKKALLFRFLLSDLGFAQPDPIICYEDNKSAICLAEAPQITRNSRHIFVRHHYIRDLVAQHLVKIQYLATAEMTADLLTKPINTKAHFKRLRDKLLNTAPAPEAPWTPRSPPLSIVSGGVLA